MGQKRPFFWPKIGFFCPVMDWQRPPPPILRVPDTRKNDPGANNLIKTNFCSPSSPKFDIFRQKWAKKGHFLAENRFFCSVGDWQRPPPPILRVPNTKKHFLASRKVIQTNFCSLSSPKSAIFCQKCAKICHFLARNRFFRPGGDFQDPPPYFKGARCNKNASQEQRNAHGPVLAASLRQNVTFFVKNQPKLILG